MKSFNILYHIATYYEAFIMLQYQIIHNYQHGFWQGYSVESQLVTVAEDILYMQWITSYK